MIFENITFQIFLTPFDSEDRESSVEFYATIKG